MSPTFTWLSDMFVIGDWPLPVIKVLGTIALALHQTYDEIPGVEKGHSKETCLFSSLAARDFLVGIGFKDATVRTCAVYMRAEHNDKELHSLGIGFPGTGERDDAFNAHAVVTIPSLNLLIDTTLYQAVRQQWSGALRGMIALPINSTGQKYYGLPAITGLDLIAADEPTRRFIIAWTDRPEVKWRQALDYVSQQQRQRRRTIARKLIGLWNEAQKKSPAEAGLE